MRKRHELDLEIVRWIGGLGAAGVEHLTARFGVCPATVYSRLTPLLRDELLAKQQLLHLRPALYVATRTGLRWGGWRGMHPFTLSPGRFEHAWQTADVAVALARSLPDWLVVSDRQIRWHEGKRRELLASVRIGAEGGRELGDFHRPDLALLSSDGRVAAIEVELSLKRRSSLVAICNGWARARHVDAVYYLTVPRTAGPMSWAVRKTRAENRVKVLALGQTGEIVRLEREATANAGGDDEHR